MHNHENIARVADAIEAAAQPDARLPFDFNMVDWEGYGKDLTGHKCGTTCCIAGWTSHVIADVSPHVFPFQASMIGHMLGLNYEEAIELFLGSPEGVDRHDVTPAMAVATMRHIITAGVVDWNAAQHGLSMPR